MIFVFNPKQFHLLYSQGLDSILQQPFVTSSLIGGFEDESKARIHWTNYGVWAVLLSGCL